MVLDIAPTEIVGLTTTTACLAGTMVLDIAQALTEECAAAVAYLARSIVSVVTFGGEGATHNG